MLIMQVKNELVQSLTMVGSELRESIEVRDGSRAPSYDQNVVELSDKLFSQRMRDGEVGEFTLEDRTPGRPHAPTSLFGMEAKIYYKRQELPVVVTLGTSYEKAAIREDLRVLEQMLPQDCGTYVFSVRQKCGR